MTRPGTPLTALFGRAVSHAITTDDLGTGDAAILDAAFDVLLLRGTKEATMDDVAARAGISRATLFRRFAGKDQLFERVLTREIRRFLADLANRFQTVTDPVDQVVEGFQACLRLRDHPLLRQAAADGPGTLIEMVVRGDPAPITLSHSAVRANIARAQAAGALPPGDPHAQADVLIHLMIGYLAAPGLAVDLDDPDAVEALARRAIAPVLTAYGHPPDDAR